MKIRKYYYKRRYSYRNKNRFLILLILFSSFFLMLGYSYLNSSVNITGINKIPNNRWDVHFENITKQSGSVDATIDATITDDTTIDFNVNLQIPGDFYSFTVDVVNGGTINAMLAEILKVGLSTDQEAYTEYIVTYNDGEEILPNDSLPGGMKDTLLITVKYKDDITAEDLPTNDQNINLNLELSYIQDDGTGDNRRPHSTLNKMFKLQNQENGKRVLDNEASTYVASPTGIDFNSAPSDTNGKGIYIKSGTENDKYPIYYYRGEVDNNNIIFAGFCWKIVRTTETGGTKLVYNGVPTNGTCNNTGTETQIRKSSYANVRNSLADSGYMRGERYISETKSMKINKDILKRDSVSADSNYYYGNSVIYENGNYILENAEQKEWSTNYETLSGYYTCKSTTTSCSTIYYVVGTDASYMYSLNYSGGISKEDANTNITLGKNIINNNDGTYTLQETTAISKTEWYNNYNEYKDYYVCSDLTSTVCDSKNYISTTSVYNLSYDIGYDYIYGNDIIYENGVYTLVDTYIAETGWSKNSSKIGLKYHYTCFSTKDTCETVYYISSTISSPSYVTLTNGKTIDTFLDEMTSKASNQYASTMKTTIDNWYKENMTEHTKYIEDTIWCNDRGIYNKGTWDKEPTTIKEDLEFDAYNRNVMTATPSLECKNVGDRFTVDETKSGRANGNGALTYPVALLTADELTLAGNGYKGYSSNSYLTTGEYYLTMTPYHFSIGATACIFGVDASGFLNVTNVRDNNGVRPSISLKLGTKISDDGDGTANNPFVVIEE